MYIEQEIIQKYFDWGTSSQSGVVLGIGDDAAWLKLGANEELVISTDTSVEGKHFPASMCPDAIGWRALAVAVSDLVASMAQPRWFLVNLTLPQVNPEWLRAFSGGMRRSASSHNIELVGGDLTSGTA